MLRILRQRDALIRSIRAFFQADGFFEVETPIRIKSPCMELNIDAEPSGDHWLRASPELYHKQLLAAGAEKIFEVGKCFRKNERGPLHHPEYTMLEWYRAGGDYMTMLEDTGRLLASFRRFTDPADFPGLSLLLPGEKGRGPADWKIFTVAEAYEKFAGWNPSVHFDADRFDLDMVEKIEPSLAKYGPVILKDYPAECCALARLKPADPNVAERWELYLNGIEIANAYSELTDPEEMRLRFHQWEKARAKIGKCTYPINESFLCSLRQMPSSGGCALGTDRLLMVLTGKSSLDDVLLFRDA